MKTASHAAVYAGLFWLAIAFIIACSVIAVWNHVTRGALCEKAYGGPGIQTDASVGYAAVCFVTEQKPYPRIGGDA